MDAGCQFQGRYLRNVLRENHQSSVSVGVVCNVVVVVRCVVDSFQVVDTSGDTFVVEAISVLKCLDIYLA